MMETSLPFCTDAIVHLHIPSSKLGTPLNEYTVVEIDNLNRRSHFIGDHRDSQVRYVLLASPTRSLSPPIRQPDPYTSEQRQINRATQCLPLDREYSRYGLPQ